MKPCILSAILVSGFAVGSVAWAQVPGGMNRSMFSAISSQVQVMTSDIVAVGRVEDAGSIEELDITMPIADEPAKRRLQKFSLRMGSILRDTAGGGAALSNTVVEVLAPVSRAVTNIAACPNQKNLHGVFLMNRIAGRPELLLSRFRSAIEESRLASMAAGVDGLSWGHVSNGFQMAVLQLSPAMASTNESSVRVGVAVRNVSNGPIVVNRAQAQKRLAVTVGGKETAILEAPSRMAVVSNAPAIQPVITLRPNQIAMFAPKGNPDSGFAVNLPPGETWSIAATCEFAGEKNDGSQLWAGQLTSGVLAVKAFKSPVRAPPRIVRPVPALGAPAPNRAVEQKTLPSEVSPRPSPSEPVTKPSSPVTVK